MIPRRWPVLLLCVVVGGGLRPAWAQREAPRAEQTFASAVQLYEQRLYPDAATALAAFRRAHSHHVLTPQTLYLEALSALARDRDEDTRRLLTRLQRTYPSHPKAQEARLRLAQYYLEQGDPKQATRQLEAIAADPYHPSEGARALYLLGRTAQRQGTLKRALTYFDRVRTEYPTADVAPAALYARGATQVRMERYDEATGSFEALGDQYPDSPFSQNLGTILGEVYYWLDRYEEAATELQQRLSELSGDARARALFLLGECYNQLRKGEAAVLQYHQVLDDHSESSYAPLAQYGLAWHYYRADRHDAAAEAFAKVRTTDASLATSAAYYEAVNRTLLGETERALELYRAFLETGSDGRLAAEAQYEVGLLLYQQEQYDESAAAFRAFLRQSPPDERVGTAHYWLGNAYLATQKLDRALKAYNRALERGDAPASAQVEVRFQKAWSLYQNQRYDEAASAFQALAEKHPNTERGQKALFWGADCYYQQGNYPRAGSLFQRYLQSDPQGQERAGVQYALAWTYFNQRRFELAARLFRQFLDAYDGSNDSVPYRQDARLRLADCYFALKRYDDAIAAYRQSRQQSGRGADYALYQAGKALYYADHPEEALDQLRRFVENFPDSPWRPDALYRIADIHFQQQNYEAARTAFRRVIDEHPDHERAPQAQYAIGDAYYNSGDMAAAVETYRTVLETYPESPSASEAASSLFLALHAAGQQDRADTLIDSIAARVPEANLTDRLRFQRARAAFQSGQSKRALRFFQEFVRTTSESSTLPSAYYYLGLLYADRDQYTEAENYLQQLVNQYPESDDYPEGALRLGEMYLDREEYEQAVSVFRAAAENEQTSAPLRAQARYGQSMALLQLGRTDEAEDLLSELLESEDQGPLLASARLGLGRVRDEQDRTSDALELYRTVVESAESETGAEALFRLGQLLREQDRAREAIRELERMPSLFAGYPEWEARALLEQARAFRDLGETGQAVQRYDQVLNAYPGTPFADTAREEKSSISSAS